MNDFGGVYVLAHGCVYVCLYLCVCVRVFSESRDFSLHIYTANWRTILESGYYWLTRRSQAKTTLRPL